MSKEDWSFLSILGDNEALKRCAERYMMHYGAYPSLQFIVRSSVKYLVNLRDKNDWRIGCVNTVLQAVLKLLSMANCDICDLFSFMEVEDVAFFYKTLLASSKDLGFSEEECQLIVLRQKLTIIWCDILKLRQLRFCLQKTVVPLILGPLEESREYCVSFIDNCSSSQRQSILLDYACLLLGYSFFFSLKWDNAIKYWNMSNWKQHHWYENELPLLIYALTSPPTETQPAEESPEPLDWDSIPVLPVSSTESSVVEHTCVLRVANHPPVPTMRRYIQSHLIQWNIKSNYFANLDTILPNIYEFGCMVICLYLCGFVSEMLCVNQIVPVCSYYDARFLLHINELDPRVICYFYDIRMLEIMINMYAGRRYICPEYENIFHQLIKQMQRPGLNYCNHPAVIYSERRNIQKQLLRHLFFKFVTCASE